ncbi:hypothetical protein GOBAR_AA24358 [Gossypium barbadense]|uniref:Retinoblastoma-associated protein A-box domain-containing protein n=1 Tax=Gossypium barbadense TaxID=3634 RepID=A0A2P5WZ45_GOSBA|nr:hypothetical protein GOBAR_AA24358 [Gossypium barbadense]
MEDMKSSVTTSGGADGDAVEARFNALCKNGLSLDEKACSNATKLFKETKHLLTSNVSAIGSGTLEEAERFWFSFVLYSLKRLSEKVGENTQHESDESGFSLCQILRATKLNIVDFFKELPQFVVKAGPVLRNMYGEDWETRLEGKEMQANFVYLSLLSNQIFRSVLSDKEIAVVILHWSLSFILSVKKGDKGVVDLLASLCNMYDASEDDLRKTMEMANKLIEDILKKKPCPAAECKAETLENIDTDSLIYFEGLMEEQSLSSSLKILEKDYDDAICNKGDLDERVFVNDEDSLLGLGSLSAGVMNVTGIKRKRDSVASPSRSISSPLSPQRPSASHANGVLGPPNVKMAATPVSTAMTTAKWLRSVICPLPSKPSAELQHFLSSCDKDVTNDVICRVHIILEAIFPRNQECSVTGSLQSVNLMDNIWMEQRRLEALKLYYRVLEAMCTAEAQILHAPNLTSLLTNERFHRCMLACSAELVLATHKTATMLFPTVLDRTGITAFDLSKVIESFIRHEESLPRELRRHLNSLEERLLESMVWVKGSSMYNSLIVAKPALSAEINRLGLLAEPMPPLDAIATHINFSGGTPPVPSLQKHETSTGNAGSSILGQNGDVRSPMRPCTELRSVLVERNAFTSPVKDRLLALNNLKKAPLQSAFASPTRPNPGGGGETCAETGISIFFGKISQLRLTFKEIICNYRKQPQCKPQVFQSVFVDRSSARRNGRTGQDNVDIIAFYNEIFVPSIKPLLGELGSAGTTTRTSRVAEANNSNDGTCPGSPKVSPFPSLPDMSPKKVSATHNIYVSPLRTSKMDALISHSSRSYYACVGESTRAYQSPSKDLTAINNHLNGYSSSLPGGRKIRGALNFDDVDVGLVSDSMVANSLYLQNGSCASSSGAPLKSEQPES